MSAAFRGFATLLGVPRMLGGCNAAFATAKTWQAWLKGKRERERGMGGLLFSYGGFDHKNPFGSLDLS